MALNKKIVFLNGEYIAEEDAKISVNDRGFQFADGIFETIKIKSSQILNYPLHQKRLESGLKGFDIKFNLANLNDIIKKILTINEIEDCIIKVIITRGNGSIGYLPASDCKPTIFITYRSLKKYNYDAKKIVISSYQKISINSLPVHNKLLQSMNSVLALMEADKKGFFEALQLNERDEICEASSSNFFCLINNKLHTPILESGLTAGVMREVITSNNHVKKTTLKISDLTKAELCFLTNISYEIMPISTIYDNNENMIWSSNLTQAKIFEKIKEVKR